MTEQISENSVAEEETICQEAEQAGSEAAHEHAHDCDCGCGDEEVFELEYSEEDIYAYIVDEDDNEIGFIILDENGEEVEYFYAEDEEECAATQASDDEFDLGITREGVASATADMNAIYKEGMEVAAELKGAYDDIMGGLGFLKKK